MAPRWNTGVVGMAEPHLPPDPRVDRRPAVLLERGRVEHAIGDALKRKCSEPLVEYGGIGNQGHGILDGSVPLQLTKRLTCYRLPRRRGRVGSAARRGRALLQSRD